MQFQATTHAERAKSVPLEKGSRKGYDYTAIFRKGFLNQKYGRREASLRAGCGSQKPERAKASEAGSRVLSADKNL